MYLRNTYLFQTTGLEPSRNFVPNSHETKAFVPESLDEEPTGMMRYVEHAQTEIDGFFNKNSRVIRIAIYLLLLAGYHVFLDKSI